MKRYCFFICIITIIAHNQMYPLSEMGVLQEAEYKLWNHNPVNNHAQEQNYEQQPQGDAINCYTKVVNCCLVTIALIPFCLCISHSAN